MSKKSKVVKINQMRPRGQGSPEKVKIVMSGQGRSKNVKGVGVRRDKKSKDIE